jgi:signal transduction histidine kinase
VTADHAERGGVAVYCDIGDPVRVNGDPVHLERLLRNLLDNAVRYANARVDVSVHTDTGAKNAVLTVQDDGPGIAPSDRERVFERFTRLDDDRSRKTGGTGLGLAIAREIAEHLHGTLRIEDCAVGTRFVARLPLVTKAAVTRSAGGRYR